jgi:hypothetical protein
MQKQELITALANWPELNVADWDLAVCLHMPKVIQAEHGNQSRKALQQLLSRYFNRMDRRLFKSAHKRRGMRSDRFVVLEYSQKVGWHAHMLVRAPRRFSAAKYKAFLQLFWLKFTEEQTNLTFRPHLFWAEANLDDGYLRYCLKHVRKNADDYTSHSPTTSVGIIDWHNTHLAEHIS